MAAVSPTYLQKTNIEKNEVIERVHLCAIIEIGTSVNAVLHSPVVKIEGRLEIERSGDDRRVHVV